MWVSIVVLDRFHLLQRLEGVGGPNASGWTILFFSAKKLSQSRARSCLQGFYQGCEGVLEEGGKAGCVI